MEGARNKKRDWDRYEIGSAGSPGELEGERPGSIARVDGGEEPQGWKPLSLLVGKNAGNLGRGLDERENTRIDHMQHDPGFHSSHRTQRFRLRGERPVILTLF